MYNSDERTYHDRFSLEEADIILCSKDNVYFRVPSVTLRMTSGFFRSTLSLPQSSETLNSHVIHLEEDSTITEQFLSIICGLGIAPSSISTFPAAAALLHTSEKYEAPGILAFVRACTTAPPFLKEPLQLYALACRYGWAQEARVASTLTLSLDLTAPELQPTLSTLSSPDLLRLFHLRWSRRDLLRAALDGSGFTASHEPYKCPRCSRIADVAAWREWKWIILEEFSRNPSGESVLGDAFLTTEKANAVFKPICATPGCEHTSFSRELTVGLIRKCINQLPKDIDEISFGAAEPAGTAIPVSQPS